MTNELILVLENRLKMAMLDSDVSALDTLLAEDLIFTNHLGQIMTKQDDLNAHKSGAVRIQTIEQTEQRIKLLGDISIISVQSQIFGEFGGVQSDLALRFTRIWQKTGNDNWQVIAAHSSIAT